MKVKNSGQIMTCQEVKQITRSLTISFRSKVNKDQAHECGHRH